MKLKKGYLGYLLVSLMTLGAFSTTTNAFAEEETVQSSNEGIVAISGELTTESNQELLTDETPVEEEDLLEEANEVPEWIRENPQEVTEEPTEAPENAQDTGDQPEASMSRAAMTRTGAPSAKMYRLYNPNSGEHFYTANAAERDKVKKAGWRDEGIGWNAPTSGNPVYRLYNPNAGDHHYTLNSHERDNLKKKGWRYEGVSWYSPKSGKALYRLYNPNAKAGSHHYTLNSNERDNLKKKGWRYEGIAWYAVDDSSGGGTTTPNPTPTFNVTNTEKEIAQKVMTKINQHRNSIGMSSLGSNSVLNSAAATRANDMYTRYDHVRPDGTSFGTFINEQAGYKQYGSAVGENIMALTYKTDRDSSESVATKIVENWKKSPGHRGTIESARPNEGAIGIKMKHTGSTYYDVAAVFITGKNKSK